MAQTKEDLIKYFTSLDVATLEKLEKYSRLLLIPDENLLTSVTMTQLVDQAHTLADTYFPSWTDRSKSDFGEFLVELFALFSEKDFWYINAFANESILRRMRSYSNAFSRASALGYSPVLCKGASVDFEVTFAAGSAVTYKRGELVVICDNKEFSNDEPFSVPAAAAPIKQTITLHEGKQVTEDVTFTGYNVYLKKKNVDVESIEVAIDNVQYTRVRNFGMSSKASNHYIVLPEADGSCSIYFGKDNFGVTPAIGKTVNVAYRTCIGDEANFLLTTDIVNGTSINDSLSTRVATAATPLTSATDGALADSLTSLKERALSLHTRIASAYNEESAQNVLNSYEFVKKSNVYAVGNNLYYQVVPASGATDLEAAFVATLTQEFIPCLMLGYTGNYQLNEYVDFVVAAGNATGITGARSVVIDVIAAVGSNARTIENEVRQIFDNITNPMLDADYGDTFSKTNTEYLIRANVRGVQSVAFKVVDGDNDEHVIEDFSLLQNQIFKAIEDNQITINVNVI